MKQIILGTAGHIDHGKTSLIKALTGTDTDRLKEEKLRGITIELGFASLDVPGAHVGIVDVPGHEKFVKNMVAGATGIDIVVMVIAADEGVMPQTREHLEICSLLGIRHGFIALTKIDMVDEEWLDLVTEDIREYVARSFLENAPIVPVSSITGAGLDDFKATLAALAADIPERTTSGLFRLPIDRVFSMKGFGTVITGALISGRVNTGDTIMIHPTMITAKIRGLQVHNQSVEQASAGMRTAINFQGIERTVIERGHVLAMPGVLKPSYMVDILLQYLKGNAKPLKNRARIRLHAGTSEIMGLVILLDRDELEPGETAVVQIRLDTPASLVRDDRFVIRAYSPMRTIGGGSVLNPIPPKHKRHRRESIDLLNRLTDAAPEDLVSLHIEQAGYFGVGMPDLKLMCNLPEKQLDKILQQLLSRNIVVQIDKENKAFVHADAFARLRDTALTWVGRHHRNNPLKAGMSREELRSKFPEQKGGRAFQALIGAMLKSGDLAAEENIIRLAGHKVQLGEDQQKLKRDMTAIYASAGLTPPTVKELESRPGVDSASVRDVLRLLTEQGALLKIKEGLYFDAGAVAALRAQLAAFFKSNTELSAPRFKEMTGISRKYLIPLLEYFDATHVTIRVGDVRKLRKG